MNDSKEVRHAYLKAKERLEKVQNEIAQIEKPFKEAMLKSTEHLTEELNKAQYDFDEAEDACPDYLGKCEVCSLDLFEGDTGFKYSDDEIYLCEKHAPTFGDCLEHIVISGVRAFDSEEDYQKSLDFMKSQPSNKKYTWSL